jgi:serine/threonine protein kinase
MASSATDCNLLFGILALQLDFISRDALIQAMNAWVLPSTSGGSRFRILRPHAKGGLGEVFLAHDEELHRQVALKQMQERHADDPNSRARFLVEAEITGGLEHPGIVPVYGLGSYADGRPFYAMRFIKGQSLREAIQTFHAKQGRAPDAPYGGVAFRQLLRRFLDACQAMQYAHDRGVLHRDLKPGNIMLGPYGETLIIDWGLAKPLAAAGLAAAQGAPVPGGGSEPLLRPASGSDVAQTQAGQTIGTPQYMSPEQAAGRLDLLGPASDVYSLGATLYCLLTGQAPFAHQERGLLLRQVGRGEFPPPRQVAALVPRALEAICLKAMATRPQDRYGSPQQLAEEVERWLPDEPVVAWPEPLLLRSGRWVRRHKPLVSAAAAALLVALVALSGGLFWYQQDQARQTQEQLVRQSEAERQRLLTEQGMEQALQQAHKVRHELQDELRKQGGVQTLLNQPARWKALLKSAGRN